MCNCRSTGAICVVCLLMAGTASANVFRSPTFASSFVDAWDASGDGVVSADEASAGITVFVGGPGGECSDGAELVEAVDADGDGGIDVGGDEARAAAAALLLCLQSRSHGAVCIGEAVIEVNGEEFACVPPMEAEHGHETPVEHDDHGHGHDDHGDGHDDHGHGHDDHGHAHDEHDDGDAHGADESSHAHDEDHTGSSDETDADAPQMRTGLGEAEEWTCSAVHHDKVIDDDEDADEASHLSTAESWAWAMLANTVTSASALVGIFFLRSGVSKQTADHMAAVAVGALLAGAFLHMLPEAVAYDVDGTVSWRVSLAVLAGVLTGYICEHSVTAFRARKLDLAASAGQLTTTDLGRHGHGHAYSHSHDHGHDSEREGDGSHGQGAAGSHPGESDVRERDDDARDGVALQEREGDVSADETAEAGERGADVVQHPAGADNEGPEPGSAALSGEPTPEVVDTTIAVVADVESGGEVTEKHVVSSTPLKVEAASVLDSVVLVVLLGDGLHNVVDGIVIGAAFQGCSIATGWAAALAIILHEVPQEVTDYVILRRAGMSATQALMWNFLSACTSYIGAIVTLLVGGVSNEVHSIMLAFSCGIFVFLAATGIMPELVECHTASWSHILMPVVLIVVGIAVVGLTTLHHVHCEADGHDDHHNH